MVVTLKNVKMVSTMDQGIEEWAKVKFPISLNG